MNDNDTDGMAELEVGLAVNFGNSFGQLATLDDLIGSTAAEAVRQFQKIEQAAGMVNMSGAVVEMETFRNASSRAARDAAKELAITERAGEALSRQMERQISTFGMSRAEVQRLKVETAALRAEQQKLPELAGRLRDQITELDRLNAETRAAAQAHMMFEARVKEGAFALREQEAAAQRDATTVANLRAMLDPAAAAQSRLNEELTEARRVMQAAGASGEELARVELMLSRRHGDVGQATNASRAAVQNLGFQLQDFAVQVVGGTSALRAFAMQAPQAAGALTGFEGKLGAVGRFLNGPWGIALTLAGTLAAGFADKLMETSDAMDQVNFSSSAVGNAQGILGNVMDITTGKITSQSGALMGLAQAQLAVARVQAQTRQAEARASIQEAGKLGFSDGFYGAFSSKKKLYGSWTTQNLMSSFLGGATDSKSVLRSLESLQQGGLITADAFAKAAASVANFAVEGENLKTYQSAQRILDGVGTSLDRGLILQTKKATTSTKAADAALKELIKTAEWLTDTKLAAYGNVWSMAADAAKRNLEWGKDEVTLGQQMIDQANERKALDDAQQLGAEQLLDTYLRQLSVLQSMGGAAATVAGVLGGMATGDFGGVSGTAGKLLDGISAMGVGKNGWKQVTDKLDSIFGTAGDGSFARLMQKTFAAGGVGTLAGSSVWGSQNSDLGSFAGGAIGEKIGEKFLSKALGGLGDFAGPLGSIVGGVLGGALGGLFSKAKWGTSVVTGQSASDITTAGNKAAYKSNAGLAVDSIQSGLQSIAEQLGADLGGYNVSIGQYKGNWRVSTSGRSGKLKGKYGDVTDFGENGAEDAIKFAIADAISDGALLGLRASTQRLIQGGLDVETQLAKALQFEGVFSELKSMTDPVGYAIETLDKEFAQLRKTFEQAGASAEEYAQLQQLYDLKRIEALKEANAETESLSRDRRTLEARILELQGNTLQSVTMMRQIELEQMEEALRPLQEQVWALEDAADAADAAKQLADAWGSIGDNIIDEVNRIRGITDSAGGGSFAQLQGQFNTAIAGALSGDQAAATSLPGLSQALIEAAELAATSRQELDRVKAQTAAALESTYASVLALANGSSSTGVATGAGAPTGTILSASETVASASAAASNDNIVEQMKAMRDELRDELAKMRAENNAGQAQIASNTGAVKRILDNVTAASGGDAVTVAGAGK